MYEVLLNDNIIWSFHTCAWLNFFIMILGWVLGYHCVVGIICLATNNLAFILVGVSSSLISN